MEAATGSDMSFAGDNRPGCEPDQHQRRGDHEEGEHFDRHGIHLVSSRPAGRLRCPDRPTWLAAPGLRRYRTRHIPSGSTGGFPRTRARFMALERTFSIIKPDATRRNLTGAINDRIEKAGLRIIGQRRLRISRQQAEGFYGVHRERPFFRSLVDFMTSGPVVVQVLEGDHAVAKYREVMGATDPAKAAAGTIRKDFAESIEANSVHGSDSPENARTEIAFFFKPDEIVG
jgi:nucleoside-diphosphate kinase